MDRQGDGVDRRGEENSGGHFACPFQHPWYTAFLNIPGCGTMCITSLRCTHPWNCMYHQIVHKMYNVHVQFACVHFTVSTRFEHFSILVFTYITGCIYSI